MANNQVTEAQALEIAQLNAVLMDGQPFPGLWPYKIGDKRLFLTASHYWTGIVVAGNNDELILDNVCWIPNTGRLSETIKESKFDEVEPVPGQMIISRKWIVTAMEIVNLPSERR